MNYCCLSLNSLAWCQLPRNPHACVYDGDDVVFKFPLYLPSKVTTAKSARMVKFRSKGRTASRCMEISNTEFVITARSTSKENQQ